MSGPNVSIFGGSTVYMSCADGADGTVSSSSESCLPDQRVWSLHKCAEVFQLRYIPILKPLDVFINDSQCSRLCSH